MNRRHFSLNSCAAALTALGLAACTEKPANAALAATRMSPQEAYAMAAKGTGFSIGAMMAANTVYVFFDTACPHCAHLWASSRPLLLKLKMVWMPLGLLRQTSAAQGATILAAPNPADAMAMNETLLLDRKGGISINPALPAGLVDKVSANTEIFTKIGAESVPLIVFRNARTGEYGVQAGAVETAQLAALVGI